MNDPHKQQWAPPPKPELRNIILGILFMLQWPAFAILCEWVYQGS